MVSLSFSLIALAAVAFGVALAFGTRPKQNRQQLPTNMPNPGMPMRTQMVVRIMDKRMVTVNAPQYLDDEYSHSASRQNIYYMTFEAKDGTRAEMEIPEPIFCGCLAGFVGTLTYEMGADGMRFVDFTRDPKYRVKGF